MTPQEALNLLNDTEFAEKHQGKEEYTEMLLMCKEALEKQIPQKTTKRQYVPNGTLIYGHCPNCDCFTKNFFKYCRNCGQALDWSDTE